MIVHNFAFRWKPEVTEAQRSQAADAIRGLDSKIPGILATYVGTNFSPRSLGYEFGGSMHFTDRVALESYTNHPAHQELLTWLRPLIDAIEVDFEAVASTSK